MQELRKIRFQSGSLQVEVYCNINKKTHDGKKGVFYKGKISCPAPGGGRAGTFRFETVDLIEFDHAARQAFVAGNLEPQSDESLASAARAVVRWTIDNGGKKWAPPLETARIFAAGVHVDERGTIVLTTAGESIQMMSEQVEFQVTAMKHADGHFSIPKPALPVGYRVWNSAASWPGGRPRAESPGLAVKKPAFAGSGVSPRRRTFQLRAPGFNPGSPWLSATGKAGTQTQSGRDRYQCKRARLSGDPSGRWQQLVARTLGSAIWL